MFYGRQLDKGGHIIFSFIITIIIARILKPEDYGLIGMLVVFSAVAGAFLDSGFGQALIRKKDATETDYNTVFYFNIAAGIVIYLLLFFAAPLIAEFYKEPKLIDIARAAFLVIIVNSTSLIQTINLTKKIDFKTLTKVNLISTILSGGIGVLFAYSGYGVWALVFQSLSAAGFRSILLWIFNKWKPALIFSTSSFKDLFGFGSKLLASGILYQITTNIYQLLIGKYYEASSVGFYTQANRIQQIPASNINSIIQNVTYPVLAEIQDDDVRLKEAYKKIIKQITFINFPVLFLMAIIAKPFIIVFLTEKWLPAAPLLTMLCIAGMLFPLHTVNLNMLKVKGRSDLFLYLDIVKNILIISVLLITVQFSVEIMVLGQVVLSFLGYFLNAYYSGRLINYTIKEQLLDIYPYLATTIIVGLVVMIIGYLNLIAVYQLITQIILFGILYLSISKLVKFESYIELQKLFLQRIKK